MERDDWFYITAEDRLRYAVQADDTKPYISYEKVMRQVGSEPPFEAMVEIGRIDNLKTLHKLKTKVIFSLRQDLEKGGLLFVVDNIIWNKKNFR